MKLFGYIRNGLILVGILVGAGLAASQILSVNDDETNAADTSVSERQPVVLNTALPPETETRPLAKPVSLEHAFGRSELTGARVSTVPANPLDELPIDRRWDVSLDLAPPKPPTDLPPMRATDEIVGIDQTGERPPQQDTRLKGLPPEPRKYAEFAVASLKTGTAKLKLGLSQFRRSGAEGEEGDKNMREAAELFRDARDNLTRALNMAPQNPKLLRLMREIKEKLYVCIKHGMY